MRSLLPFFLVMFAAACGGSSASIGDPGSSSSGGASSSGGTGSSSGSSSGTDGTGCPPSTQSAPGTNGGTNGGPAPPPRTRIFFDVVNSGATTLYVVNDDSEHEMVEISSGGTKLRLTTPPGLVCGKNRQPTHKDRFLFAIPPGGTRTIAGWDKSIVANAGKHCVVCATYGRPDLGAEYVEQYVFADAAPGPYGATVHALTALPAGCSTAGDGFHCAAWAGIAALSSQVRSAQTSVSVSVDRPTNAADEHVPVIF